MRRPVWTTCSRGHRFLKSADRPVCPKCWPGHYRKKKDWTAKKIWSKKYPPSRDITAFIQSSPAAARPKLRQIRRIIKKAMPGSKEVISYRMPAFALNGKPLVGFAGFRRHIGFYPMSGSFLNSFKKELKGYKTSKGAVQFLIHKPLPVALIKKMVRARMRKNTR